MENSFIEKIGGRKFILALVILVGILCMPIAWNEKQEAIVWIYGLFAGSNAAITASGIMKGDKKL